MTQDYLTDHEVYIAYYNDKPVAISQEKNLVVNYMEVHRSLLPDQYTLELESVSDIDLLTKYDEYIISEFHGSYIPNIDQEIIDVSTNSIDMELYNTIESLKHIIVLSTGVKQLSKSKSEIQSMVSTLKVLNDIKSNGKLIRKLNKQEISSSSILYLNMKVYLAEVKRYQERKMMTERYRNLMYEY